jgi:hypothetical protein
MNPHKIVIIYYHYISHCIINVNQVTTYYNNFFNLSCDNVTLNMTNNTTLEYT